MGDIVRERTATIEADDSLSDVVDVSGVLVTGLVVPSSWDSANLTFQGGFGAGALWDIYTSAGAEWIVTAVAGKLAAIDPTSVACANFIRIRSGTAGSPVTQSAQRQIILAVRT